MKIHILEKICPYCSIKFEGDYRQIYCNSLCRSRSAYHRFAKKHPDKKTKSLVLQRWYAKRHDALKRGLEFSITDKELDVILKSTCFYCGIKPKPVVIERFDNNQGYIPGNCVPSCTLCNQLKGKIHGEAYKALRSNVNKEFVLCIVNEDGNLLSAKDGSTYYRRKSGL